MKNPQRVNPYDQRVKDYYTSKTFRNYIIGMVVFVCIGCACICLLPPVIGAITNILGSILEWIVGPIP